MIMPCTKQIQFFERGKSCHHQYQRVQQLHRERNRYKQTIYLRLTKMRPRSAAARYTDRNQIQQQQYTAHTEDFTTRLSERIQFTVRPPTNHPTSPIHTHPDWHLLVTTVRRGPAATTRTEQKLTHDLSPNAPTPNDETVDSSLRSSRETRNDLYFRPSGRSLILVLLFLRLARSIGDGGTELCRQWVAI